ncbi:MAG: SusD/RagB family nutrient-binding outer membrane lipoprotein [Bacteroidales bacterium]
MKKKILSIMVIGAILLLSGCEKYLDINRNPNGPEKVTAYLYLAPMLNELAYSPQYDIRMIGYYTQNFANYSASSSGYDAHGTPAWTSDMAQYWRTVYWKMGWNLSNMISQSEEEQRWDLAGIGYALRAWGWQELVDMHGPIILKEAFQPGLYAFDYDTEQEVYTEVIRLCDKAIELLNRTDGAVSASFAAKGDLIYAGNRVLWKRFAWGLKARNLSRLSNKTSLYDPAKVIQAVDSSFKSNADNAYLKFNGSVNEDASFFGPMRYNYLAARPSKFIVSLLDGTALGTISDPRIRIMLPPSQNIVNNVVGAQYVGVTPTAGYTSIAAADRPYNIYGLNTVSGAPPSTTIGTYIFTNNGKWPLMTYSEMQFIKAEAALRNSDAATALTAYSSGVSAAIDFTNLYAGATTWATIPAIDATAKANFMTSAVPALATDLKMWMIMGQKYVHMWAWGAMEIWTDMRRYHYTDTYGTETKQVFAGLLIPPLAAESNGKPVYRVRPRYNSEYVWNMEALKKIGADKLDYHTNPLWITIPE